MIILLFIYNYYYLFYTPIKVTISLLSFQYVRDIIFNRSVSTVHSVTNNINNTTV